MHTSMIMAVNPQPTVPRRSGSTSTYRQIDPDYENHVRSERQQIRENSSDLKDKIKKEKKWSIGNLFRKKKKEDESVSSSESDSTNRPRRKQKKKKRSTTTVNNFDVVVDRNERRAHSLMKHSGRDVVDEGVLSDPSAGFIGYRNRPQPLREPLITSKESLNWRDDCSRSGNTSLEGSIKKTRKGRLKARVEALRNSMRKDSSSDEESQKSSASSSMIRFRSDDSLMHTSHSSLNKRSRSARTERYIKRLSRDEENQLNKEAELLKQGYTKAEVEMLTRTPTSQSSGYGTCKRENGYSNGKEEHVYSNDIPKRPIKSESVSSFPSTHSRTSSINFNAKINNDIVNYSIPFKNTNNQTEPYYANNIRERAKSERYDSKADDGDVMCVKFPLGNVTNLTRPEKAPPAPPPRDLNRKIATPVSMLYENQKALNNDSSINRRYFGVVNNDFDRVIRRSQERSLNAQVNRLRRPVSNSEDHIAIQPNDSMLNLSLSRKDQPRRPASVSAEPNHYAFYVNTPWRKRVESTTIRKPEPLQLTQDFLYFADQNPRSRRPISIKSSQNNLDKQYLSDSQTSLAQSNSIQMKPRNASEFWKRLDNEEAFRKRHNLTINGRSASEDIAYKPKSSTNMNGFSHLNYNSSIQNNDPSNRFKHTQNKSMGLTLHTQSRESERAKAWKPLSDYKRSQTVEPNVPNVEKTHIRHKSDSQIQPCSMFSDEEVSTERRKSTNLDDALNELEAIYNSLGLGDEDLLDRAERRELMSPKFNASFNDWNGNAEYELRSQPTTPLRRIPRRSTLPDKLQDDMAFRRLNSKDRSTSKDPSSNMSYMLASPVYIPYTSDDDRFSDKNEPDVVYDDVVYRNIKQANSRFKIVDPQPPFGIPVGPVSPAPQSDYLHAIPDGKPRPRFIPRRSPDLVSDDLAYRNLRKDNRNSSAFNNEGYFQINNNSFNDEIINNKDASPQFKKKRAVRSLSANIFTMIQKEIDDALNMSRIATVQKTQSNNDINKSLFGRNSEDEAAQDQFPKNKVKHRHNTVNIFVSNIPHPSSHYAKDDSFINHDQYLGKPPSGDKSKSSSPASRSPQSCRRHTKDEFQQVLSMLAQEAMATSNKLGVALAELDKNKNNSVHNERIAMNNHVNLSPRMNFLSSLTKDSNTSEASTKINLYRNGSTDVLPEQSANCVSKPNVIEDNKTAGEETKESLLAISDQLSKVENKIKHTVEREEKHVDESINLGECIPSLKKEVIAQQQVVNFQDSGHLPEILSSDLRDDVTEVKLVSSDTHQRLVKLDQQKKRLSNPFIQDLESVQEQRTVNMSKNNPFLQSPSEDNNNGYSEQASFKDLKEGISDLIAGISHVNEKLFNKEESKEPTATNRNSTTFSLYEDDLQADKETLDPSDYNSSEELAIIFKNGDKNNESPKPSTSDELNEKHNDLNSPRLVQSINQRLRHASAEADDSISPSQTQSLPATTVPWRTKQHNNSRKDNQGDSTEPRGKTCPWYQDPSTLMFACYTLVCSQQLAELDWLTLLGLLLAMISIIAMLLI